MELERKKMIQTKFGIIILIMAWTTLSLRPEDKLYERTGTKKFLINTKGCYIPNYGTTLRFLEPMKSSKRCGPRLIFVTKLNPYELLVNMDRIGTIKPHSEKPFHCCYKFASRSLKAGKEDTEITYTKCKRLPTNGTSTIPFKTEYIKVVCARNKLDYILYKDHYALLKEKKTVKKVTPVQSSETYNVLVIGIDTMSRARTFRSMPRTANYLLSNGWIDYKGYNKVGLNTFPNVMSLLTGKKIWNIEKGMNASKHLILWQKFKDSGYITAYGEDNLDLPDTFRRNKGFTIQPTDHYMRPLFILGEKKIGNSVCCGRLSSGIQVLNYAADFAKTYRNRKMFGWFWINSFSHNTINLPSLFDRDTLHFFENLSKDILENTFILFLSDHGIRFFQATGKEPYYADRLPLFFIWIPFKFRVEQVSFSQNLVTNQHRLTTPYDVYMTLQDILKLSNNSVEIKKSEDCPQCSSLFKEKSSKRTCADAAVDKKWCCCHKYTFSIPRYKLNRKFSKKKYKKRKPRFLNNSTTA